MYYLLLLYTYKDYPESYELLLAHGLIEMCWSLFDLSTPTRSNIMRFISAELINWSNQTEFSCVLNTDTDFIAWTRVQYMYYNNCQHRQYLKYTCRSGMSKHLDWLGFVSIVINAYPSSKYQ